MSSSRAQSSRGTSGVSPENSTLCFSPDIAENIEFAPSAVQAGSLNDAELVRVVLVDAMKQCNKSRAQIADEMSFLTGTAVSERMLNNFSAVSRENRFPAELDRAFCAVVGNNRLMTCRAERAGLHVIDETGMALLDLGREFLRQKQAAHNMAELERRLQGAHLG